MKSKLILCILISCVTIVAFGQAVGEYRSKQNGNWNLTSTWERFDGANWVSAIAVPSSTDGVITITGTHQVTVSDSRTVDQTFVNAGAILIVSHNLIMNDGVATDLTVHGTLNHSGTLGGNGLVLVTGTMNWTTGFVSVNLNLSSSAVMNLTTSSPKTIVSKSITNQGTINWTNGTLSFENGLLQNSNAFIQTVDNSFNGVAGTGVFTNTATGTFVKTTAGITNVDVAVNNEGTININNGTLSFNRSTTHTGTINTVSGTTFQNNGTFTNSGLINIESNVTFNNVANSNPGNSFTQNNAINFGGTVVINNSATWNLNVPQALSSTMTLNLSGRLGGNSNLIANGPVNWTNGTVACNLILTSLATMVMSTSNTKTIETNTIRNQGTINWTGGALNFLGGKLQNENAFNQSVDQPFNDNAATGLFTNTSTGTFTKSVGTGLTQIGTHVSNAGTININSGTLSFTRTTTHSGTINTASGITFRNTGDFTDNGTINIVSGVLFTNEGNAVITQNNLINFSGTVNINNNSTWNVNVLQVLNTTTSFFHSGTLGGNSTVTVNGPVTWTAGTVAVNLTLSPTATLTMSTTNMKTIQSKTIINHGTINWTGGALNFLSGKLQNENIFNQSVDQPFSDAAATGLFNNTITGIFTKSGSGLTNINVAVTNAGTIKGTGTLSFNRSFTNTGIVAPGLSPGILTVNGTEPFGSNSTLSIEVKDASGAGTGHDQLQRAGDLTLTGTLTVLETGTVPDGDYIIISLTSGTISGTFSSTTLPSGYTIIYNSNNVVARKGQATCVPGVSIVAVPGNTICSGLPVIFTATPTNGGTSPSYQWKLNGSIVGTNSNTYSNNALVNGDQVSCVMASSAACASPTTATSNTISMIIAATVTPSVSISANPGNTICAGTNVTFTATPIDGGATPSYQWKLNGNNIGTNSNTYSNNSLINGDLVACIITSSAACAIPFTAASNIITITVTASVTPSVSISANPGTIVCTGTNVVFTATPTNGGATPSYQWKLNGNNVGTNSNTYSNNALVNGGQISVVMTSSLACASPATATSNIITITTTATVAPSVSISANPGNTNCAGTYVTFTAISTNGGTTPSYQWKLNGNNVGTNNNTYSNNGLANGDQVSVVMTSSLACASPTTATSNTITITVTSTVTPSVSISANPGNTICAGTNMIFTATPTNGGTTPSYQWKLNGSNVGTNSNIYSNNALANGDQLSVVMTSSLACASPTTATSNISTMTTTANVIPSVSISVEPGNTICAGTNVIFTATPTNGGSPSYQWKLNGNNVGTNSNTFSNNALANGDQVSLVMTSSLACASPTTATSNTNTMTVTTTVTPSVSISANPGNTICAGTNVTFTATPTNGGTPSYQWELNGNNVGTNSNTYSNNALANGDQVSCVMTSSLACADQLSATSNSMVISIISGGINATIAAIGNRHRCPQTLQANPGGDVSYQWYMNGIEIIGATERRYVANNNGKYSVRVTRNGCSGMSAETEVTGCPPIQTRINTNKEFTREGLPSVSQNGIHLYPNPASDYVTIELQENENVNGEAIVQLLSLHGQVLLTQKLQVLKGKINGKLKLNSLWKEELYLVKVMLNKKTYTCKLIKINP